ncbi:hypothetical protein ACQP1G_16560 [Nocardia sp. CA-107356]|uniref:hypothetical protein n=1 Tax=Nocardia sp. CA-107356 TaxID=3239972 RepID=UPI003D8CDCF4
MRIKKTGIFCAVGALLSTISTVCASPALAQHGQLDQYRTTTIVSNQCYQVAAVIPVDKAVVASKIPSGFVPASIQAIQGHPEADGPGGLFINSIKCVGANTVNGKPIKGELRGTPVSVFIMPRGNTSTTNIQVYNIDWATNQKAFFELLDSEQMPTSINTKIDIDFDKAISTGPDWKVTVTDIQPIPPISASGIDFWHEAGNKVGHVRISLGTVDQFALGNGCVQAEPRSPVTRFLGVASACGQATHNYYQTVTVVNGDAPVASGGAATG